jgi:hypothetical protein
MVETKITMIRNKKITDGSLNDLLRRRTFTEIRYPRCLALEHQRIGQTGVHLSTSHTLPCTFLFPLLKTTMNEFFIPVSKEMLIFLIVSPD